MQGIRRVEMFEAYEVYRIVSVSGAAACYAWRQERAIWFCNCEGRQGGTGVLSM